MEIRTDLMMCALAVALTLVGGVGGDWTTNCSSSCKCVWSHGKKSAECEMAGFSDVPRQLSSELQILNLNKNHLHRLVRDAFKNVSLVNLHKVFLKNCNIAFIDKESLSGMKVLIEIDLSYNNIRDLHRDLFKDTGRIREVRMTNNPIRKLENGLFSNLKFLQIVDFSNCKLHEIGHEAFSLVPAFTTLELKGNNFTNLPLQAVSGLASLKDLGLANNPWKCDCKLRDLRNWAIERKLYAVPTSCKEPRRLYGRMWNDIQNQAEFACKPEVISVGYANYVFSCLVEGDPLPNIQWTFNGKPITNHSYTGSEYLFHESSSGTFRWYNLTLRNSRGRDSGEYKCVAESFGGEAESVIDKKFDQSMDGDSFGGHSGASYDWQLVIILIVGALLLIVCVFVAWCCCKKRNSVTRSKKDKENTNGSINQMIDSEEKSLINVINPVQKPPRRQDASLSNSETELHESNASQYNENGSILGSVAPESKEHSIGSAATLPRGRPDVDNSDALLTDRCPPDLLSFPGKSNQGSPVDNVSYLATTDRGPFPRPQKLLNSPQYGGQFGTLPYSRSHSPFSPPLSVVPRQSGYVTIPRRPRVPSWSSSLSPVAVSPEDPFKVEPIYDNLGPRTTADGSSVLSLNKCDVSIPNSYKNRPLPQTPSDQKRYYEPISELDSFSPILKNSRTPGVLVHRSNPNIDKIQRDSSTPDSKRQSWARITPEGAQVHSTDETESLISPGTTNPNITAKKIPPNPPPKPKKKIGKSPFYEDEGEDGTEV